MRTLTQINVPFHSADLVIIEFNNQPFTAMRPIVEGMGLTWQSQYEKLKQRFSSVITEIVTTGKDGKQYNMVCLPVRKLFGWLMTISPNKVNPEIRDTVIMYQQECDDVLWEYWTKGQAINQRLTISPEQQNALHEIVDRRAGRDRSLRASMWIRHNRHFGIAKYSQLLSIHFDEAKQYLELLPLQELVPAETDTLKRLEKFVDNLAARYPALENPLAYEIAQHVG
ncbi:phage antirepressor N-terminal domain-containing protein, partial [Acinetobacter baumannii]